ncbi:hypothetical protein PR202_gb28940 [Eleusine coracana subsp. coracana]|uniref:Uncharacterized protein n=1 Tax=Eleusine coracana subsp. coracana TaxID=191504 RepID=A0AAV5FY62_ELECO|nr:hypothetical protein PR202_gb28940 [Eleusine coracana subsp. coracana]
MPPPHPFPTSPRARLLSLLCRLLSPPPLLPLHLPPLLHASRRRPPHASDLLLRLLPSRRRAQPPPLTSMTSSSAAPSPHLTLHLPPLSPPLLPLRWRRLGLLPARRRPPLPPRPSPPPPCPHADDLLLGHLAHTQTTSSSADLAASASLLGGSGGLDLPPRRIRRRRPPSSATSDDPGLPPLPHPPSAELMAYTFSKEVESSINIIGLFFMMNTEFAPPAGTVRYLAFYKYSNTMA